MVVEGISSPTAEPRGRTEARVTWPGPCRRRRSEPLLRCFGRSPSAPSKPSPSEAARLLPIHMQTPDSDDNANSGVRLLSGNAVRDLLHAKQKGGSGDRSLEFGKLHDKHAPMALNLILDLRGLYIKFGQAAASSPFVPRSVSAAFKQLQSDVPSEDLSLIKQVIEEDLGPISQLFSEFSETACGAASIGQRTLRHYAVPARRS